GTGGHVRRGADDGLAAQLAQVAADLHAGVERSVEAVEERLTTSFHGDQDVRQVRLEGGDGRVQLRLSVRVEAGAAAGLELDGHARGMALRLGAGAGLAVGVAVRRGVALAARLERTALALEGLDLTVAGAVALHAGAPLGGAGSVAGALAATFALDLGVGRHLAGALALTLAGAVRLDDRLVGATAGGAGAVALAVALHARAHVGRAGPGALALALALEGDADAGLGLAGTRAGDLYLATLAGGRVGLDVTLAAHGRRTLRGTVGAGAHGGGALGSLVVDLERSFRAELALGAEVRVDAGGREGAESMDLGATALRPLGGEVVLARAQIGRDVGAGDLDVAEGGGCHAREVGHGLGEDLELAFHLGVHAEVDAAQVCADLEIVATQAAWERPAVLTTTGRCGGARQGHEHGGRDVRKSLGKCHL